MCKATRGAAALNVLGFISKNNLYIYKLYIYIYIYIFQYVFILK